MEVQEVTPNVDSGAPLAGAQFVDAYRVVVDGAAARQAAEKMFARLRFGFVVLPCRVFAGLRLVVRRRLT